MCRPRKLEKVVHNPILGVTQDKVSQAARANQDKANEAGNVSRQKCDQTKQGCADASKASQNKLNEAK